MTRAVRSIVIVAALASIAGDAAAQFNRGIMRDSVEVTLSPLKTPDTLLPSGTIRVDVKNASTAPSRVVDSLQSGISRQILENDSRLEADPKPSVVIVVTVTDWSRTRRSGTRWVSEKRQTGTRQVTDSKGNKSTEPVYEYGHNERTTIQEGSGSIRLEVRHVSTEALLDDMTVRVSYREEAGGFQSAPTDEDAERAMVDRAVRDAAAKVSPGREPVRVLMGRSDEVDSYNDLARDRRWPELVSALQQLKPHRDAKRDAYRLHNIAVGHEAIAYQSSNRATVRSELQQAAALIAQAVAAKKDEKYFGESSLRINNSLQAVEWMNQRELVLAEKFPNRPAPKTAARATAPAAVSGPATTKSPTKGDAMTNQDVIDLVKAGLDDKLLIATIREASSVTFDVGPGGLKTLLGSKVSNAVIAVMRERAKTR